MALKMFTFLFLAKLIMLQFIFQVLNNVIKLFLQQYKYFILSFATLCVYFFQHYKDDSVNYAKQ